LVLVAACRAKWIPLFWAWPVRVSEWSERG
jgi:hypothetical protein